MFPSLSFINCQPLASPVYLHPSHTRPLTGYLEANLTHDIISQILETTFLNDFILSPSSFWGQEVQMKGEKWKL